MVLLASSPSTSSTLASPRKFSKMSLYTTYTVARAGSCRGSSGMLTDVETYRLKLSAHASFSYALMVTMLVPSRLLASTTFIRVEPSAGSNT